MPIVYVFQETLKILKLITKTLAFFEIMWYNLKRCEFVINLHLR